MPQHSEVMEREIKDLLQEMYFRFFSLNLIYVDRVFSPMVGLNMVLDPIGAKVDCIPVKSNFRFLFITKPISDLRK